MGSKIKKLRKNVRRGDVNLMDLPLERLRQRHVRSLAIVANSALKENSSPG